MSAGFRRLIRGAWFWLALGLACLIGAWPAAGRLGLLAQPVSTAFSVEFVERSESVVTGQAMERRGHWAERSDGAVSSGSRDTDWDRRVIMDPNNKAEVWVSDLQRIKTTFDVRSMYTGTLRRRSPQPQCAEVANATLLGIAAVAGHSTYHYESAPITMDGGATQEVHRWLSPECGCFQLQEIVYKRSSEGVLQGVFSKRPLRVVVGDPDPKFFSIPNDYREVRPSEFEEAIIRGSVSTRQGSDAAARLVIPRSRRDAWAREDARYDVLKGARRR
jgi:hypothetical protein